MAINKCTDERNIILAQSGQWVERRRKESTKFAVGMVVTKKKSGYDGVIVSWDVQCKNFYDLGHPLYFVRFDTGRCEVFEEGNRGDQQTAYF